MICELTGAENKNKKQNILKYGSHTLSSKKEGEMATRKKGTAPFEDLKNQKIYSIIIILAGLLLIFITAPFVIIKIGTLVIVSGIVGVLLFFVGLFYFLDAFFN